MAHARRMATMFVEGFDAADTERISAKSLADEQEGLADFDNEKQFRPAMATTSRSVIYTTALPEPRLVLFELGRFASQLATWRVKLCANGNEAVRAKATIITLPLGILQLTERERYSAVCSHLPEKREAAGRLGFGPDSEAVLRFHEPFWEDSQTARHAHAKQITDAVFFDAPDRLSQPAGPCYRSACQC